MQGTPWGLLELESNGSNVFQEVFHVDQVVPSLPHSCVFSCDFANWWLWTTCHREHNTSKQSKLVSFRLKVPNYVPNRSQHMKRQPYFGNTTTFCNNVWHWCSYNRPYWNWGGTDDHTTLQNKILVTQKKICFSLKKFDGDLTEDKEKCLGPPLSSKFRGPKACLILKE